MESSKKLAAPVKKSAPKTVKSAPITKFADLSKDEKKVQIAKDVINQIIVGRYRPKTRAYIEITGKLASKKLSVKDNFEKLNRRNCEVCALGACLLAITHHENKLNFKEVIDNWSEIPDEFDDQITVSAFNKAKTLLDDIFTAKELALIECMFEGYNVGGQYAKNVDNYDLSDDLRSKANCFYGFFNDSESGFEHADRLVYIMTFIIKNKGKVKVPNYKEYQKLKDLERNFIYTGFANL